MPPKHTLLVPNDQFKDIVLPPDYTFHGSDGRPISSEQVVARVGRGETIEIYHQGASVGRVRPPRATDRFSPHMVNAMGELLEKAWVTDQMCGIHFHRDCVDFMATGLKRDVLESALGEEAADDWYAKFRKTHEMHPE